MGACAKRASELALVAVNCVLLVGGAVVLYVALRARASAWANVVRSYVAATDAVLTTVVCVAAVLIALAVLGSVAALSRWRLGLLLYACACVLLLLAFAAVVVGAFLLRGTANDWENAPFPASDDERAVKREFDTVYCAAQGEYICNSLTVQDAVAMFSPQLNSSALLQRFADVKGVGAVCEALGDQVADLIAVCDGCATASAFKNLTGVFDWANDKCPRTQQTLLWCGAQLSLGSASDITIGTAPYTECRDEFLGLVESTAFYLGIGSIVVCVGAVLVIGMSCYLRRRESFRPRGSSSDESAHGDDDDPYTPTAARAMYHKA